MKHGKMSHGKLFGGPQCSWVTENRLVNRWDCAAQIMFETRPKLTERRVCNSIYNTCQVSGLFLTGVTVENKAVLLKAAPS